MSIDKKKISRLTQVAKMYYEQDLNQSDIAKAIGVSRPMVSKLLAEAKELKIVTITINEFKSKEQVCIDKIKYHFHLEDVLVLNSNKGNPENLNEDFSNIILSTLDKNDSKNIGIGCGSTLGMLADSLLKLKGTPSKFKGEIFPLIGGIKATFKSYHTNELVRCIGESVGLNTSYLYLPALLDSKNDKDIYTTTDAFKHISALWNDANTAFINISNVFAAPDLATSIRFGDNLKSKNAVGRFLAHYYDLNGNIIEPLEDNVLQIEISTLHNISDVFAMCSIYSDIPAIIGALNTGIFNKLVIADKHLETLANRIS